MTLKRASFHANRFVREFREVARCGTLFDMVVGSRLMGIGDKVGCGIAVFQGNGSFKM